MELYTMIFGGVAVVFATALLVAFALRRVVSTNEVHIVQSAKRTTSYGADSGNGNTYYEWPSYLPFIGITKIVLPINNFTLNLNNYEAYDKGRLPFVVDIQAFFQITDSNTAAKRVSSYAELQNQLNGILQGAARSLLASNELEEIMQGRSKFGDEFTHAVNPQLQNWGVSAVKNIELMDIRDHAGSAVIKNIMDKKKSHIEMESRTAVANNQRLAQIAEIEAKKEVALQDESAKQAVGLRKVENEKQVSLSHQSAIQQVKEQEKVTKEKEMNILSVSEVRKAEIARQSKTIEAEQFKATTTLIAEGQLEAKKRDAEAVLALKSKEAEGIALEGKARAEAEKAMQLAPVTAQITLAKEIGANAEYQKYLLTVRQIEASEAVGIEQAKALGEADIKVISNVGTPTEGLSNVMDVFSSKGGMQVGAMLEGLAMTEKGKELVDKVTGTKLLSNGNGHA